MVQTADQVVFPADVIIKRRLQPEQQEFSLSLKVKKSVLETFLILINATNLCWFDWFDAELGRSKRKSICTELKKAFQHLGDL